MEDKFRGLLARYYDRELGEDAARAVELHLAGCAECRSELAALRALSGTLAQAAEPASSAGAEACWQAVQSRLGPQTSPTPWRGWLLGFLLLALQAILGLAGLVLAIGSTVIGLTRGQGLTGGPSLLPDLALPVLLPGLPVPVLPLPGPALSGIVSTCLFASAGVLYLIWLAAWWSRSHAAMQSFEG